MRMCRYMARISLVLLSLLSVIFSISVAQAKQDVPVIVGFLEWGQLNPEERVIYVNAYLETHAFIFYSAVPDEDTNGRKHYNAFISCIENTKDRLPTTDEDVIAGQHWSPDAAPGWIFAEVLDKSAAWVLFREIAPLLCEDYFDGSDSQKQALQIYTVQDWNNFSHNQRILYVASYLDTALTVEEIYVDIKGSGELQAISACIQIIGLEGILTKVEKMHFDHSLPLPWSVAKGFGNACGKYRGKLG